MGHSIVQPHVQLYAIKLDDKKRVTRKTFTTAHYFHCVKTEDAGKSHLAFHIHPRMLTRRKCAPIVGVVFFFLCTGGGQTRST